MAWKVGYTNEFEAWWDTLAEEEQEAIDAAVELLQERGPALGRPLADNVHQSRHPNMKELRPLQTIRVLFAFDPRRVAILLIGGDKRRTWNRWYDQIVPVADALYDDHLEEINETSERRNDDGQALQAASRQDPQRRSACCPRRRVSGSDEGCARAR